MPSRPSISQDNADPSCSGIKDSSLLDLGVVAHANFNVEVGDKVYFLQQTGSSAPRAPYQLVDNWL